MMAVMMAAADGLRQVLDVGELAALRGAGEVRGKLAELVGCCRVAIRGGGLSGGLQVGGDLPGKLLILGWIRLLKLLESAQQLRQWRKLTVVRG